MKYCNSPAWNKVGMNIRKSTSPNYSGQKKGHESELIHSQADCSKKNVSMDTQSVLFSFDPYVNYPMLWPFWWERWLHLGCAMAIESHLRIARLWGRRHGRRRGRRCRCGRRSRLFGAKIPIGDECSRMFQVLNVPFVSCLVPCSLLFLVPGCCWTCRVTGRFVFFRGHFLPSIISIWDANEARLSWVTLFLCAFWRQHSLGQGP